MGNMLDPNARIELKWTAGQQGQTGVDATAVMLEDRHFEIVGDAVADGNCAYDADHGLKLTTTGGGDDQCAMMPCATDKRTLFRELSWSPEYETEFECVIRTGALANAVVYVFGLTLTFPATYAAGDDNDRIVFSYLQGTDSNWNIDCSIANTDVALVTEHVVVATEVVHFAIRIDSARRAHCFINEDQVYVSSPLTAGTALLPVVGIEEGSAAGKSIHVRSIAMSRKPLP